MQRLPNNFPCNRSNTSGNVFVIIFVAVILFGLLGYTFTKSANKGTGNLTKQQTKILVQELISFFNLVDAAYNKLRIKGCSESDISFSNSGDTAYLVAFNDSPTAPLDNSCHIFNDNGGKVFFNMDWTKFQIPLSEIPLTDEHGNIQFLKLDARTIGVGTAADDIMTHLNYVRPEICIAYNQALNLSIDYSISDSGPILGDENTEYVGQENVCRSDDITSYGQIRKVWLAK